MTAYSVLWQHLAVSTTESLESDCDFEETLTFFFFILFFGAGDGTQDLALARQALYH
ncbi:rCG52991, isoform CRA_b [Rattus norvegicus]|uniref:RCG52991, isoform CRA_b n=1 Tax=Rattus norvegicus TaxID=10116 RepID=A6IRR6_RAT|nr:rCG52991, isoform CRA_b [Rattus norvegicus]